MEGGSSPSEVTTPPQIKGSKSSYLFYFQHFTNTTNVHIVYICIRNTHKTESMFWKRKEDIRISSIGLISVPPPKKEFETMLQILRDAEKYDNAGEMEVSKDTLNTLCEFINRYIHT